MRKNIRQAQHLFLIKTLNKLGIERNLLNMIKDIYKKSKASTVFNGQRLNVFPQDQEQDKDVHS